MSQPFDDLLAIVAKLRAPDGCPWDQKQTHDSLKPYLIEESYEVLEALDRNDSRQLREELGDLLLQVFLHSEIEKELDHFTMQDVIETLSQKLVRRHPHVFEVAQNAEPALNADQVVNQWEKIKQGERTSQGQPDSLLEGVPASLPALLRAYQVQKRAARVGFDWEKPEQVIEKLDEELQELREASSRHQLHQASSASGNDDASLGQSQKDIEEEFGDVLFTIANLARHLQINPEEALRKSCNKFVARFRSMEQQAAEANKGLQQLTLAEWETLWDAAKADERTTNNLPSSSS
ncbi:MAG: nucleoside triphosphate pyrophosphohydrolase [Nitrospirae bacterium]|nr:nucleoside triphosphate pyrophosphohydrolase [Nitrospirota bacterium]MDA1305370.1 nucleoside triphosphate pyrophosphohydrolase [Nitrospirota bacterium]